jgi:predicted dehydrogenase
MNEPLRVALVGYGYWGPNLARNIEAGSDTELAAICDSSPDARALAGSKHRDAKLVERYDDVLNDDGIEAVVLALPMAAHHATALQALEHGKHVMVEKPLARTVAECDELVATAADRGLQLMVGHTFIFNEAVRMVKRYLTAGELGDPYYVGMRRTNLGIVRSDGNAMWSLAPHDISILDYWFDRPVASVRATGAAHLQEGIEDVVWLSIQYEGGVVGHIHCSWLEPNKVRDATIVGSRKMVVYDDTNPEARIKLFDKGIDRQAVDDGHRESRIGKYADFATFQMLYRAGDVLLPRVAFKEPLAREISHFAACVREQEEPLADGRRGRQVVAVLEAAQRSLEAGGAPQTVEVHVDG